MPYDPVTLRNTTAYRHEVEAEEKKRLASLPPKQKPVVAPKTKTPSASSLEALQKKFGK